MGSGSRCKLALAAWVLTALCMTVPIPGVLMSFWLFPIGILRFVYHFKFKFDQEDITSIAIGWLCYIVLTVAVMATRRRTCFVLLYIILCVALAMNVIGCHELISAHE